MRARASTSVAPLAIAIASARCSTSAQRGATSTRSRKPITFIARAAAPTLPAWLVSDQDEAGRIGGRLRSSRRLKLRARLIVQPRSRARPASPRRARLAPKSHPLPCPKRCTPCSTSPSRRPAPPGRSSTAPRWTSTAAGQHRRRRTTSSPRSTTPPRPRSSTCCSRPTPATASWPRNRAARTARKDSEYVWIIDPLDGTTNFIHGLPTYAVSIALALRGQVQQAVVYDPARNDLFFASQGPRRVPQRQAPARLQAHAAWPTR